jgi:hypothetical protein
VRGTNRQLDGRGQRHADAHGPVAGERRRGGSFSNISGATSPTLTFNPFDTDTGKQYRAVFTNGCGSVTTSPASLTVNADPVVTTQPRGPIVCAGQTVTFRADATGTPPPSVQWQVSTDGNRTFSNIAGATSPTFSFTTAAADDGKIYRAVFSNACGTVATEGAFLIVNAVVAITTHPSSQTVCAGQTASLTAAASGTPTPAVQWQVSTDGGNTFSNIAGATDTTLSFTATAADSAKQYRVVFTNLCNSATTSAASLAVNAAPPTFTNCPPAETTAIATCVASAPNGIGAVISFPPLQATDPCSTPSVSYDPGHAPGSVFPLGNTTVTATATGATGNSATCPFTVSVAYAWSGVLQPINADGSSVFKAGSTVTVKFQLTDASACVTNAVATPLLTCA